MKALDFWQFVHERHSIWRRRFVEYHPSPWTADPVLRSTFFTNVFRELDPGTRIAMDIVSCNRPAAERIWNLVAYRRLNREETWRVIGYGKPRSTIREMRRITGPVFTGAHQIHPLQGIFPGNFIERQDRLMLWLAAEDRCAKLAKALRRIDTPQEAYKAWLDASIPGVGAFLSWQLALDCRYGPRPLARFSDDEWAPVQAGAMAGLKIVCPEAATREERERALPLLRDRQDHEFKIRGIDYFWPMPHQRLTVAAIEHSLCEFSKYHRVANGGHAKNKYLHDQSAVLQ